MKKIVGLTLSAIIFISSCKKDNDVTTASEYETSHYNHEVGTAWMDLELRFFKNTSGFTPPVASRALGYTGLVLYETVHSGMSGYKSAGEVLGYSYALPNASGSLKYNWSIAANVAMKSIIQKLFANASAENKAAIDSLYKVMVFKLQPGTEAEITSRSEAYGNSVASAIFEWSKSDNGHEGYNTGFPASYIVPTGAGFWIPTPPAYQAIPLQPYWGNNRPFLAKNVTGTCVPPMPITFSDDTASDYYKQVLEVYQVSKNLSDAEKSTALYWADGGNTITPPGHNMNLATQALKSGNADLAKTAEVYLRMGLAQSDAFVACWKGKFLYNTMRPVTYIRQYIDPNWSPLIATPPFPEYGSGHSTCSGAAAEVLTAMFGNRAVTDQTNDYLGYPSRTYSNFYEAANEAAVSRLYGGIHFRNSNDKALLCGKEIGRNIADIKLK